VGATQGRKFQLKKHPPKTQSPPPGFCDKTPLCRQVLKGGVRPEINGDEAHSWGFWGPKERKGRDAKGLGRETQNGLAKKGANGCCGVKIETPPLTRKFLWGAKPLGG